MKTVEHLLSACAGLGLDNLVVDITNEEVPILDGSAAAYVYLLQSAGIVLQDAPKRFLRVKRPVEVREGEGARRMWARLEPHQGYRLTFEIEFDHPVVDQTGQRVTNATLSGKVYVANFFFSRCQAICPKMLKNLRHVQDAFATEPAVALVSHTVLPAADSQPVLAAYAQANGVRAGKWHLLTGDKEAIYDHARTSYFAEKRPGLTKSAD